MTITLAWWMLPTAITLIAFATVFLWPSSGGGGWFPDLTPLLLMIPALFVSLVAWVVYAVLK